MIDAKRDELGIITCSSCGARLRTKAPVKMTVRRTMPPGGKKMGRTDAVDRVMARVDGPDLDATLRPGGAAPRIPRPEQGDPNATVRPGGPVPRIDRPQTRPPGGGPVSLEAVLTEMRAIRLAQEEILRLLRAGRGAAQTPAPAEEPARENEFASAPGSLPTSRTPGRHVLLVDDDADTAASVQMALEAVDFHVKTARDGNECLAAVAMQKPDVIVLEVGIGGSMPGKDVINMIKATMEWVDIPIVLFTRQPLEETPDALQDYSADAIVAKAPGAEMQLAQRLDALLARV